MTVLLLVASLAFADCTGGRSEEHVFTLAACEAVVPMDVPRLAEFYRKQVDKESAKRTLDPYLGVVLTGATTGTPSKLFLAGASSDPCVAFSPGDELRVLVASACCDGDPNPPCYLGFRHYVEKLIAHKRAPSPKRKTWWRRIFGLA